jgi:hypothetical protein
MGNRDCGESQTLIHVLNTCKAARDARRINARHDAILAEIVSLLAAYTEPTANLSADLSDYRFPQHIVPTDLRPDIVWWDDSLRRNLLIELTICFETSFHHAAERKELKYEDVMARARSAEYSGCDHTTSVIEECHRSCWVLTPQSEFDICKQDQARLLSRITSLVLQESYKIWCQRNYQPSL